jgi:hypothetical protein
VKVLLWILGGALALLGILWAVFTFVVKPKQTRSPQDAAANGLAIDGPKVAPLPQAGVKPANPTAVALNTGGSILSTLGGAAQQLGIRL